MEVLNLWSGKTLTSELTSVLNKTYGHGCVVKKKRPEFQGVFLIYGVFINKLTLAY